MRMSLGDVKRHQNSYNQPGLAQLKKQLTDFPDSHGCLRGQSQKPRVFPSSSDCKEEEGKAAALGRDSSLAPSTRDMAVTKAINSLDKLGFDYMINFIHFFL
ncbi:hypothetical protein WISP_00974 [Willisornis vidua]|uniref:Uncharacterized protein n=1 Tax=Willisornis vidua TaxID=1566151 RepID=A0ABQ9DZI7_9PASS|nr:hypothetical protein WISP_00974 [Willisornis vidua]